MEIDDNTDKGIENKSDSNPDSDGNHDVSPSRTEISIKRQMKKNDSGISVEKSESEDETSKRKKLCDTGPALEATNQESQSKEKKTILNDMFPLLKPKVKHRNYRSHSRSSEAKSSSEDETGEKSLQDENRIPNNKSPDSGLVEDNSNTRNGNGDEPMEEDNVGTKPGRASLDLVKDYSDSSSSSSSSTSALDDQKSDGSDSENEEDVTPSVLLKEKPKHKWFIIPEVLNRQLGCSNKKHGSELFQQRMYGSLHTVQRLELIYKLEQHSGCVNSLHFDPSGSILVSCSDDLHVCLWDWPVGKLLTYFDTGHRSNVFQAKFLPLSGNTHMCTCARDGQVRIIELASNGQMRSSRRVAQHRGPTHKLSTLPETPHVFLSCGEDAVVNSIDVRQPKPEKILLVKDGTRKIPLYSIFCNPMNSNEFVISGRDNYVRIYDQRDTSSVMKRLCPHHLMTSGVKDEYPAHVTCATFNYNGTEVLASYNDDDIYLFDMKQSDESDFIHRYGGHRNSATVKGVNFFGPRSEFIISGSDCGNIFFWEKKTEAIVQWMAGDENGVVNCLETHPQIPVLATSGLDEDVKIWVPSCEEEPGMEGLKLTVITNQKGRDGDRSNTGDSFDGQMLWILWRHIRRTERMRAQRHQHNIRAGEAGSNPPESSSSDSSASSEDEEGQGRGSQRLQCSPS